MSSLSASASASIHNGQVEKIRGGNQRKVGRNFSTRNTPLQYEEREKKEKEGCPHEGLASGELQIPSLQESGVRCCPSIGGGRREGSLGWLGSVNDGRSHSSACR